MTEANNYIAEKLEEMARTQAEQSRVLANLESRILLIHDDIRRSAETVSRLKLMADNAKKVAHAQGETLSALLSRLESAEK